MEIDPEDKRAVMICRGLPFLEEVTDSACIKFNVDMSFVGKFSDEKGFEAHIGSVWSLP